MITLSLCCWTVRAGDKLVAVDWQVSINDGGLLHLICCTMPGMYGKRHSSRLHASIDDGHASAGSAVCRQLAPHFESIQS